MEVLFFIVFIFIILLVSYFFVSSYKKENVRLKSELDYMKDEREVVLDFLHKIVLDIGEGADKGKIYSRILRTVMLASGASSSCIYEVYGGKLKMVSVEGLFPPQHGISSKFDNNEITQARYLEAVMSHDELLIHEGVIGSVAADREAMMIIDAESNPNVVKHESEKLKTTSMIIVPIVFAEKLYGVLAVANPIGGGNFSDEDFSVICSIVDQASLSIFNVETMTAMVEKNKLEYDLDLASNVQSYLLPMELPKIEGYEFASKYIPHQKIGGDFFDVIELKDGKIGMIIADVSGKGMPAAILMTLCQTKGKYIAEHTDSPKEVLVRMNDEMFSYMRRDMFITLIYAVLDKDTGEVTMARAGHELPILYKSSIGHSVKLKSRGMAVGMVETKIFKETVEEIRFKLDRGDTLLMYTDGVTEALDCDGVEFSTERLLKILDAVHLDNPEYLNNGIVHAVQSFTGKSSMYEDDFTLLSVKRV